MKLRVIRIEPQRTWPALNYGNGKNTGNTTLVFANFVVVDHYATATATATAKSSGEAKVELLSHGVAPMA